MKKRHFNDNRRVGYLLSILLLLCTGGVACEGTVKPPAAGPLLPPRISTTTVAELLAGSCERLLSSPLYNYNHHDHRENVTFESTHGGHPLGRGRYRPFGAKDPNVNVVNSYGFSGQEQDHSTGLLHFRHRHLDPVSGRWTSPDPHFTPLTRDKVRKHLESATSAFAYVANTPLNAIDPLGLFPRRSSGSSTALSRRPSSAPPRRPAMGPMVSLRVRYFESLGAQSNQLHRTRSAPALESHTASGLPNSLAVMRRHHSDTAVARRLSRNGLAAEPRIKPAASEPATHHRSWDNSLKFMLREQKKRGEEMHRRFHYMDDYNRSLRSGY